VVKHRRALDPRNEGSAIAAMSAPEPSGYYLASSPLRQPGPALMGCTRCDVCVIGGGYTGLSAALHSATGGRHTVLLEARTVGFGASGRNGGQIHSGHRKGQAELERWLGKEHARDLWTIAEDGKGLIRKLVSEGPIACDLKDGLIVAAHDHTALRALEADAEHARAHYASSLTMMTAGEIAHAIGTDIYCGGPSDPSGGHLHPLKFALGLAAMAERAGATIHENSRARAIREDIGRIAVETDHGAVNAGTVILACDAFSGEVVPALARYIGHVESFIVATEPLDPRNSVLPSDAAVADTRHVLDYYRKSADGRLLFAGRESYFSLPKDIARLVRPRMLRVFPSLERARIEYAWSGTVGITSTRMPHFGRIGKRMLFGHGYSGHGVALSVIGGKALAEAALGSEERFEALARVPAVPFPGGQWLRRPMISAALAWYKLVDAF